MNHFDQILTGIHALEPLPAVCTRVMQLAGEDSVVPGELVAVIQTDAGITAKVLRLCNSAYYGFSRQVDSLDEAGNRLGVNTLVNLVLTACSGNYFKSIGNVDSARATQHWERSISNALAASLLARIQGDVNTSSAYTVGLLQDIGEIIIDRFAPAEGEQIRREVLHGRSRTEAELDLIGMDHAEVGARLAAQWHFPESLVDAIRFHHDPPSAKIAPELASTACIADSMTSTFEDAGDHCGHLTMVTHDVLSLVGLEDEGLLSIESQIHDELERAKDFVSL